MKYTKDNHLEERITIAVSIMYLFIVFILAAIGMLTAGG